MSILYTADSIIPSRAASSIHVMKMCHALSLNGHRVTLLVPARKGSYEPDVGDIFSFYGIPRTFSLVRCRFPGVGIQPFFVLLSPLYAGEIGFHLDRVRPDVVYGRSILGCTVSALCGYETVFELHAPIWELSVVRQFLFRLLTRSRHFKKLVVISGNLKAMFVASGRLPAARIQVAHDGADEAESVEPVTQWPGRPGALQVGYFGHLYPGRGIETVIRLAESFPDMDFHLFGGEKESIAYWEERIRLGNLYLRGLVPPGQVQAYRSRCDVLLAPYQHNIGISRGKRQGDTHRFMSPLKIFEYMASRRPMIVSDFPVIREVLNDETSCLVEPEDLNGWRRALERLREEPVRKTIADAAYREFMDKYRWQRRAERVIA